jgi:hypothetical protein
MRNGGKWLTVTMPEPILPELFVMAAENPAGSQAFPRCDDLNICEGLKFSRIRLFAGFLTIWEVLKYAKFYLDYRFP